MAAQMSGLDLSHWNPVDNFVNIRKRHNFVILKAGGSDAGFYKDKTLKDLLTNNEIHLFKIY